MLSSEIDAARHAIQATKARLVLEAKRCGHLDGSSRADDGPFRVRVTAELANAGSEAFAALDAEHRRAVASREEARRRLKLCDAVAPARGWLAWLRNLARWWARRRIAARESRETERAAETEALLPQEAKCVGESTAYVIAVYCEAAARGRAAAAVVAVRGGPRAASRADGAIERALRRLDCTDGGVS